VIFPLTVPVGTFLGDLPHPAVVKSTLAQIIHWTQRGSRHGIAFTLIEMMEESWSNRLPLPGKRRMSFRREPARSDRRRTSQFSSERSRH